MYSKTAVKIYAAKQHGLIKSNAHFRREFGSRESISSLKQDTEYYEQYLTENDISLVCAFDENFPALPPCVNPATSATFLPIKETYLFLAIAQKTQPS